MDSVEPWRKALQDSGLGDAEVAERIRILDEFCELAELDPDGVVEACVDRDRGRIVAGERKKVESLIDEFAADGDPRTATRRANVVRSFLIHNGVRVLAPKAPWL